MGVNMGFCHNVNKLLASRGLGRSDLVKGTGIPDSSIRSWSRGAIPSVDNAYKVACYFGVTIESLLLEDVKEKEENKITAFLSVQEVDLLSRFRKLSPTAKDLYLNMADLLAEQEKRQAYINNVNNEV